MVCDRTSLAFAMGMAKLDISISSGSSDTCWAWIISFTHMNIPQYMRNSTNKKNIMLKSIVYVSF